MISNSDTDYSDSPSDSDTYSDSASDSDTNSDSDSASDSETGSDSASDSDTDSDSELLGLGPPVTLPAIASQKRKCESEEEGSESRKRRKSAIGPVAKASWPRLFPAVLVRNLANRLVERFAVFCGLSLRPSPLSLIESMPPDMFRTVLEFADLQTTVRASGCSKTLQRLINQENKCMWVAEVRTLRSQNQTLKGWKEILESTEDLLTITDSSGERPPYASGFLERDAATGKQAKLDHTKMKCTLKELRNAKIRFRSKVVASYNTDDHKSAFHPGDIDALPRKKSFSTYIPFYGNSGPKVVGLIGPFPEDQFDRLKAKVQGEDHHGDVIEVLQNIFGEEMVFKLAIVDFDH